MPGQTGDRAIPRDPPPDYVADVGGGSFHVYLDHTVRMAQLVAGITAVGILMFAMLVVFASAITVMLP